MLVVSQAVLSCGFSASSAELSFLYAVIQPRISGADMTGLSQNAPSGVFAEGGSQGDFSLCLLPDLDPVCPGESLHGFCHQLPSFSLCSNSLAFLLISFPLCH